MEQHGLLNKESWLAVSLSFIVSGLGQIYAGRVKRGCVIFLIYTLLSLGILVSIMLPIRGTVQILMAQLTFFIWSLRDAHKCVRLSNDPIFESSRKAKKDPWLAVFLTLLVPGLGHLYLRKWIVGPVLLISYIFLPGWIYKEAPHIDILFLIINASFLILVCLHIRFISRCYRDVQKKTVIVVPMLAFGAKLLLLVLALLFIDHIAQAYSVAGGSMEPTLVRGDRVFVNKLTRASLQRGDVVIFRKPGDLSAVFVERIAALENDTVEMLEGNIYINGKKTDHTSKQIPEIVFSEKVFWGEGQPFTVPSGHIFLLGDNIDQSYDSRYFGPVPCENIIGKANKIYWPLDRTRLL